MGSANFLILSIAENCNNLLDSLMLKMNKKASLQPLVQNQKCLPHPQPLPLAGIKFHPMIPTSKLNYDFLFCHISVSKELFI